jgi:cytochrome b subunit of formate dehydrogenase
MPFPFEDREVVRTSLRWGGMSTHIYWFLGAIFAIIGIVGGAIDARIGLEATHWFLLSIALFAASVTTNIGFAVSWYLETLEAKNKEKE